MASVVHICNRALQRLGADSITSSSDDSREARACNLAYTSVRDSLLRSHPWSFAIKRASLAASSTSPVSGYDYKYQLPSDCLRLLPTDSYEQTTMYDWKVEDGYIVTNDSAPIEIRYISRVDDPNKFDSLFAEALGARMAMEMCEQITQSNTKWEIAEASYKAIMLEARRANAFELPPVPLPTGTWITDRL